MTRAPSSSSSSSLGQVKVEGEFATLIFERRIHHFIDAVWRGITESSELSKWYFSRGEIEGKLGGKLDFFLGPAHVTGSVLVWDPRRVFGHEWFVEGSGDRPGFLKGEFGVIRWELDSVGSEETFLKLTHTKLLSSNARDFVIGVHVRLDRLEAFLSGSALPFWKDHLENVRGSYLGRST